MRIFSHASLWTAAAVVGLGVGTAGLAITPEQASADTTVTHTSSNFRSAFAQVFDFDPGVSYYARTVSVSQIGTGQDRVSRFVFSEIEIDYTTTPLTINQRFSFGDVPNSDLEISSSGAELSVDTTAAGFTNSGRGTGAGWAGGEFEVDISKVDGGDTIHDPMKFEYEYEFNGTTYTVRYHVNGKQDEAECDITLDGDDLFEDGTDNCSINRSNTGVLQITKTEE